MTTMPMLGGLRPDPGAPSPSTDIAFKANFLAGGGLPAGSSLSRADAAYQFNGSVYELVGANTIRDNHFAFVGAARGALLEEDSTNQMPVQDMSDPTWSPAGFSSITSLGIGSVGFESFKITENTSNSAHRLFDEAAVPGAGTAYVIAENLDGRYLILQRGTTANEFACFDLQDGVITQIGGGLNTARIKEIKSGVYKCIVDAGSAGTRILISTSDTGTPGTAIPTYQGTGRSIITSHVQYENGVETSPIRTAGAAASRAADVLDTGVDPNGVGYTVYADATGPSAISSINAIFGDSASTSIIPLYATTINRTRALQGPQLEVGSTNWIDSRLKAGFSDQNSIGGAMVLSVQGGTSATDTGTQVLTGSNILLGVRTSQDYWNSVIHEAVIYNRNLSQAELEALVA